MRHVQEHLLNSWRSHVTHWNACTRCSCAGGPKVFGDGKLPCDVLYVTSHPEAADVFNDKLMSVGNVARTWVELQKAVRARVGVYSWFAVSLLACQPSMVVDGETVMQSRLPCKEEIESCSARLHEVLRLSSPKKIIALGDGPAKVVKGWYGKKSTGLGFLLPETWHKELSVEYVSLQGGAESLAGKKWIGRVANYLEGVCDAG